MGKAAVTANELHELTEPQEELEDGRMFMSMDELSAELDEIAHMIARQKQRTTAQLNTNSCNCRRYSAGSFTFPAVAPCTALCALFQGGVASVHLRHLPAV